MRLLYTSDLHGSMQHYSWLLTVAQAKKPDVVILGGDLLPDDDVAVPDRLGVGQAEFVRNAFKTAVQELKQKAGCREVLVIFGNHDWGSSVIAMEELAVEGLVTILKPDVPHSVDGLNFLGYSYTPPTPWYVKEFEQLDMRGDTPPLIGGAVWHARHNRPVQHGSKVFFDGRRTIEEDMAALKAPAAPWVFVAHAPPYQSKLDQSFSGNSYGSKSIRDAIERLSPMLSLHGHIHESPRVSGAWKDQIGSTTSMNAGQKTKAFCHLIIDIDVPSKQITHSEHGQEAS